MLLFTTALPNTGAGLRGPERGDVLPDFAAPLATEQRGRTSCDANVCQKAKRVQRQRRATLPACEVGARRSSTSASCARSRSVLTFVFDQGRRLRTRRSTGCERMKDEFPGVNFAVVY